MDVIQHFHMNGGTGETSYSSNSFVQKKAISMTKPILEEAILDLFSELQNNGAEAMIPSSNNIYKSSIGIADMGCSSGPNTFSVISYLMHTIFNKFREEPSGCSTAPEFLVFLNDLPGNDFNTIFRSLEGFYDELRDETKAAGDHNGNCDHQPYCFVVGVPGSFYGRLFPAQTLHFVHSSYSLHWLSQVPQGIDKSNKGNIYLAKSSPSTVVEAYLKQFQKDFSMFLRSRSKEVVGGGRMVLTLLGRSCSEDACGKECCYVWELLAAALRDMVSEGMIEEEKLDSFNLPHYKPSPEEVKSIILSEGSFIISRLETFEVNWDGTTEDDIGGSSAILFDKFRSSYNVANCIRAASESLLVTHFGDEIIDELFRRYREIVADGMSKEKTRHLSLVVSLRRA